MKKQVKKLVLAKETVQNLELQSVKGGGADGSSYCPSGVFWTPCPEH